MGKQKRRNAFFYFMMAEKPEVEKRLKRKVEKRLKRKVEKRLKRKVEKRLKRKVEKRLKRKVEKRLKRKVEKRLKRKVEKRLKRKVEMAKLVTAEWQALPKEQWKKYQLMTGESRERLECRGVPLRCLDEAAREEKHQAEEMKRDIADLVDMYRMGNGVWCVRASVCVHVCVCVCVCLPSCDIWEKSYVGAVPSPYPLLSNFSLTWW
ncbi:trichohyalin-like isoform X3 [Eriocheir sinensis]|uniref:trichohyalin-like isoform X3 n=1 Tax=Eriocheir sinensis TaxID=95602 RepID=UPI0021C9B03F|nr:trichohyalin-like isoform X3 [Eriocheir sinensis]